MRPGYKQTEVGVIPEDWKCERLGECARFRTGPFGSALHKSDYTDDGIPVVNPMHIVDGEIKPTRTMSIAEEAANRLSDFRLKAGEIVIGRRGDMGRCAVVRIHQVGWLCGTGSMIIRCESGIDARFLQRVLSSPQIIAAIEDASVGTTMINLNQGTLAGLKFQVPPISEQRAIAEALSDADGLLAALDRLIAKKRDLKQAAMQQLLTGQTRLPGFHGAWEVKRLGDMTMLYQPVTISAHQFSESGYPVYGANGVVGFYRDFNHDSWQVTITCRGSTCGTVNRTVEKCWITGNAMVVNCDQNNNINKEFLYFALKHKDLSVCITGTGQPQIVREPLANVELKIPVVSEQTAIAEVLSDMDAELAALEQQRNKTRLLKQAMMQELLTGRTRLI